MNTTVDLGHIITLLGYVFTTVAAAGAISVRLNRVERDIDKLMALIVKQGKLEERVAALEDRVDRLEPTPTSRRKR